MLYLYKLLSFLNWSVFKQLLHWSIEIDVCLLLILDATENIQVFQQNMIYFMFYYPKIIINKKTTAVCNF